ncbi:MAG TPA: efflux RND transporter periplasmic adaptor subunit, partial [Terriglobia bacterium]|nr:efflux RND transporter periplasmic adaptor subunit [Terriglobia bacterium]
MPRPCLTQSHVVKRRRASLTGMRRAAPLLSLVLLAGCSTQQPDNKAVDRPAPAVKVQVAAVKEGHHSQSQRLPGTVRAMRSAALASKLMGTILQVRVQAGDRVKAGQLLAVIDSREAEAMIHKAEAGRREAEMALQETENQIAASQANLTLSDATLKRYETLRVEKSVTPQEFEEVQARQRAATASLEALQARKQQVLAKTKQVESDHRNAEALHSYAELRAPFDGVITQKHADPGSLAVPGVPVLTVEETGRYRLEVPVEESRVSAIKPGQKLEVRVAAAGHQPIPGVVREIEASADPASRTYLVKVELPLRSVLRSGMYGEALLPGGPSDAIWIESRSIVRQGQIEGVYVVEGSNVARLRLLKLGSVSGNQVEVLSGLTHAESYVLAP